MLKKYCFENLESKSLECPQLIYWTQTIFVIKYLLKKNFDQNLWLMATKSIWPSTLTQGWFLRKHHSECEEDDPEVVLVEFVCWHLLCKCIFSVEYGCSPRGNIDSGKQMVHHNIKQLANLRRRDVSVTERIQKRSYPLHMGPLKSAKKEIISA